MKQIEFTLTHDELSIYLPELHILLKTCLMPLNNLILPPQVRGVA